MCHNRYSQVFFTTFKIKMTYSLSMKWNLIRIWFLNILFFFKPRPMSNTHRAVPNVCADERSDRWTRVTRTQQRKTQLPPPFLMEFHWITTQDILNGLILTTRLEHRYESTTTMAGKVEHSQHFPPKRLDSETF